LQVIVIGPAIAPLPSKTAKDGVTQRSRAAEPAEAECIEGVPP